MNPTQTRSERHTALFVTRQARVREWLIVLLKDSSVLPLLTSAASDPLYGLAGALRDGRVLCTLAERLSPGSVGGLIKDKAVEGYRATDNINTFLNVCRTQFQMKEDSLFETFALYSGSNIPSVIECLYMLGTTVCSSRNFTPTIDDIGIDDSALDAAVVAEAEQMVAASHRGKVWDEGRQKLEAILSKPPPTHDDSGSLIGWEAAKKAFATARSWTKAWTGAADDESEPKSQDESDPTEAERALVVGVASLNARREADLVWHSILQYQPGEFAPVGPWQPDGVFDEQQREERAAELHALLDAPVTDLPALSRHVFTPPLATASALMDLTSASDCDDVARALVAVFHREGDVLALMRLAIEIEVRSASSSRSLFLHAAMPGRVLSVFARSIAGKYVRALLGDVVTRICSGEQKEVVGPSSLITVVDGAGASQSSASDSVALLVNTKNLVLVCEALMRRLVESIDDVPLSLRYVAHYLQVSTSLKFPDRHYTAVGWLLFYRLLCPAIATPERYGLHSEGTTSPESRRALKLVAKCMQNVASGIQFTNKGAHMKSMNGFIGSHITVMRGYLDKISTLPPNATAALIKEHAQQHFDVLGDEVPVNPATRLRLHLRRSQNNLISVVQRRPASSPPLPPLPERLQTVLEGPAAQNKQALVELFLEPDLNLLMSLLFIQSPMGGSIGGRSSTVGHQGPPDGTDVPRGMTLTQSSEPVLLSLMHVFEAYGQLPRLVTAAISFDMGCTSTSNDMLMGHTLSSRVLSQCIKLVGKPFLEATVTPLVREICRSNHPAPPSGPMSSEMIASLTDLTTKLMTSIHKERNNFPSLLHDVCWWMSSQSGAEEPMKLVAMLVFDRFLIPSVASPDTASVRTVKVSTEARKTLIVLSKILKAIARGRMFDDDVFSPFNPLVKDQQERLASFLDAVSQPPQTPRTPDPPSCSPFEEEGALTYLRNYCSMSGDRVLVALSKVGLEAAHAAALEVAESSR